MRQHSRLLVALAGPLLLLGGCELLVNPDKLRVDAGPGGNADAATPSGLDATTQLRLDAGAPGLDASIDGGLPDSGALSCAIPVAGTTLGVCSYSSEVCSADGWCWESPLPHGQDINGLWADPSGGPAWAVSSGGIVLQVQQKSVTQFASWVFTPAVNLRAVWGAGSDVWVVGDGGLVLHWDGFAWSGTHVSSSGDLHGIWGLDAQHLYAVGDDGIFFSGTDMDWTNNPVAPNLRAVSGDVAGDVWAVGQGGAIVSLSASGSWQVLVPPGPDAGVTEPDFNAVSVVQSGDVWLGGYTGDSSDQMLLLHWTSSGFQRLSCKLDPPGSAVTAIVANANGAWVTAGAAVWLAQSSCTGWYSGSGTSFDSVALMSNVHLILGGDLGLLGTADVSGSGPTFDPLPADFRLSSFNSVFVRSATDVWIGGSGGGVYKYSGTRLSSIDAAPSVFAYEDVVGVSGGSADTVMVTAHRFYRGSAGDEFPGASSPAPALDCAEFHGMQEAPSGTVGAVSYPACDAGVGELWIGATGGAPAPALALPGQFDAIASDAAAGWVLAGDTACHCATACSCDPTSGRGLEAVAHAQGGTSWFAVGAGCQVYSSSDGISFSPSSADCSGTSVLRGVWLASETQGWAVGDNGTILALDGSDWKPMKSGLPSGVDLRAVHGVSGNNGVEVWAVGTRGTALRLRPR